LLESCCLYGKTKTPQKYSIRTPEAHGFVPRNIEAKKERNTLLDSCYLSQQNKDTTNIEHPHAENT
jgi:hypothetical protein